MLKNFFAVEKYSDQEISIIAMLLSFNEELYLRQFPDVAAAGVDPLKHFLSSGMYEARFPWQFSEEQTRDGRPAPDFAKILGFDKTYYSERYPDVPGDYLRHFIQHGMRERRQPFAFNDNVAAEHLTWDVCEKYGMDIDCSLDRQLILSVTEPELLIEALWLKIQYAKIHPKTYRNNFWMALAACFLAKGYFGASALCYNYFFNYFLPMPYLGNCSDGICVTGKCTPTIEYARRLGLRVERLESEVSVDVGEPVFLNRVNPPSTVDRFALPPPYYCVLENTTVIGGNSMILVDTHEFLYDYMECDGERPAEIKGPNLLHVTNGNCSFKYIATELYVEEAFSLLHDHGHNYFHWLIEVLPRYLLARRNALVRDVTILIDEQIGNLQEDVLRHILGKDARLMRVPRNSIVRVGKLHWVSDISRNTVHTRDVPMKSDILISPTAIALLREMAQPFFMSGVHKYEKLQIVRHNVEFRRLVNRKIFRTMLNHDGFWGFDPGAASFEGQVRAFSNARIVVAEAGAALANVVFCQPGAILCVLVNGYKNSNYFYIVQMARTLGVQLVFFECARLEGTHELGVHDDMVVHVSLLKDCLAELIPSTSARPFAARATTT